MIVGFGDRGLDGPHQSNAVRKSSWPPGQAIVAIADRMRRLSSDDDAAPVCRSRAKPDPPTRQDKGAGPTQKGSVSRDPPAKSTRKTTHKELGGVKGRSRQEDKSMHKRLDQVIVEFPKERRINSTVRAKEQGVAARISLSGRSLDFMSLTDATSCLEKQSEWQHSMPNSHAFTRKHRKFENELDWSQTSIDWGGEDDDTNYEKIFDSDQNDVMTHFDRATSQTRAESMTSLNDSIRSFLSIR
ncbi:hypothetical protein ACHAW5_005317 [Stephanodiscus triporus]|uniref:Uncharacterized protein n=1 Tax=Stephanodiscus triporus TaxID=2934178 RepID=A0ABD3NAB2_9STRA